MPTKHFILTTLFSCTALLACDDGSPELDPALDAAEQADPALDVAAEAPLDAPEGIENLPFARVEMSEGHELRFFVLPDMSVAIEESAQLPGEEPLLTGEQSPLEVFWRWTEDDRDIPTELLANYETYVGDPDAFFDSGVPRGTDLMTADEIQAPPKPPQASKWWPTSCPAPTGYNYISCSDGSVSPTGTQYHFIRIDGPIMYMIERDTNDTNRDVKLYYGSTIGGNCSWSYYTQLTTGQWSVVYYTGSAKRSWQARIAPGCTGACYYYRSIFQYDAAQTSTCLPGIG